MRPIPGLRELPPLTNENLFDLPRRPESMIVLGSGPIGCEMAQAFARLGTRITLVEALDRILPREEPDASEVITEALADAGVEVDGRGAVVVNAAMATTVKGIWAVGDVTGTKHFGGGRLVGAAMVAPTGGELIHEAALAMQTHMFVGRLAQTIHAYPTRSMGVQQAALQFFRPVSGLTHRPARRQA